MHLRRGGHHHDGSGRQHAWLWPRGVEACGRGTACDGLAQRSTVSPVTIEYRIDAENQLAWVGPGWAPFARANDAPTLARPPLGRPIWESMADDSVRRIWQLLVERLRAAEGAATVPFRCDAPATRRWFEMTVTASADGAVHFNSVMLAEEPRPSVDLLETGVNAAVEGALLRVCSWCCRCHDGTDWVEVEDLVRSRRLLDDEPIAGLTHGICSACLATLEATPPTRSS